MKKNHHIQGFTLLELSIVLIIGGLMVVGAIEAYTIYTHKQKIERTKALMTDIDQYLSGFPSKTIPSSITADARGRLSGTPYSRLPAPAPLNGSAAGNDYDTEVTNTTAAINAAVASGNLIRVTGASGGNVLIGKLPAATLGISNDYMRDAYGNYLLYAVTEAAVTSLNFSGAIEVIEEGIDYRSGSPTEGELIEHETHPNVQYVVVSMGETANGAIDFNGDRIGNVCPANTVKESENCDMNDATFRLSMLHERNTNDFYDDAMIFESHVVAPTPPEEPAGCDQKESFSTYGDSCPDGWDVIDTSSISRPSFVRSHIRGTLGVFPTTDGFSHSRYEQHQKTNAQYYNVDENGDYFFSDTPLPETTHSPTPNAAPIMCSKAPSNTSKTKCFNNTINVGAYPQAAPARADELQNAISEAAGEADAMCPDGWRVINFQAEVGEAPDGGHRGSAPLRYKTTCSRE